MNALLQSIEDITRIVREAQQQTSGMPGWDEDEYIDDTMDNDALENDAYESSFDEWGMTPGS